MNIYRFLTFVFSAASLIQPLNAQGQGEKSDDDSVGETASFQLLHLWAEDIEAYALKSISDPVKAQGVNWSERVVDNNFHGVRSEYAKLLAVSAPPDGASWIGGGSTSEELVDTDVFRPIPVKFHDIDFSELLKPEVLEAVEHEQAIVSLPLNIHLQNRIVYNRRVLNEIGESTPRNWDEFLRIAAKAEKAGYAGLSISDERWQLRFLVESVLTEYLAGPELKRLMSNGPRSEHQKEALEKTIRTVVKLREFSNADSHELTWVLAAEKVAQGQAMAVVTGDFAAPLFSEEGSFICEGTPGSQFLLWSFDTIVFSNTPIRESQTGQDILIKTVADLEVSSEYVARKGGISPYKVVNYQSLNECAEASIMDWNSSMERVLMNSDDWTQVMDAVAGIVREHWHAADMDSNSISNEIHATLRLIDGDSTLESAPVK